MELSFCHVLEAMTEYDPTLEELRPSGSSKNWHKLNDKYDPDALSYCPQRHNCSFRPALANTWVWRCLINTIHKCHFLYLMNHLQCYFPILVTNIEKNEIQPFLELCFVHLN